MARAKFSIGIDLGTTNCAMAFEALEVPDSETEVFLIPQWEKPGSRSESATLPSFLYLPAKTEAAALGGAGWVVGRLARKQAAEQPGRVIHSAKSWLCHHAVDRDAPFLPWRSDSLQVEERISPVRASATLLTYLRAVWDLHFENKGPNGNSMRRISQSRSRRHSMLRRSGLPSMPRGRLPFPKTSGSSKSHRPHFTDGLKGKERPGIFGPPSGQATGRRAM